MSSSKQFNSVFIYEVNLSIELPKFLENKDWLISHFHDMVIENNFTKLNLFFLKNVDSLDDSHLRYQKLTAQYYISNYQILKDYLEKEAKKMRSQVTERLGRHYTVSRRVLELVETFKNDKVTQLCELE